MDNDKTWVLAFKLFVICLCVAFGLSTLNFITKDKIAEATKKEKEQAMVEVLPDCTFEQINDNVYKALKNNKEFGYAVNVISKKGYSGDIELIIGFDKDLKVTGIKYITMSETPGLGMKAKEDSFNNQFMGKQAFADTELQAITGATKTSKAVNDGINMASDMIKEVAK